MIELKLDTTAMNALFPEGTEARVKLQSAVIDNMLRGLALKDVKHMNGDFLGPIRAEAEKIGKTVRTAVDTEIKRVLLNNGIEMGWHGGPVGLKEGLKQQLNSQVRSEMSSTVKAAIEECQTKGRISRAVEMKIEELVSSGATDGLKAIIKKCLAEILAGK